MQELKEVGFDPVDDRRRLTISRPFLEKRSLIMAAVRRLFVREGFLEVETPTRIPAPAPELHIEAEEASGSFLITSPELQMKRLVASGSFDRIFQICHCFRRNERGEKHLPEFSMLEWYRVDADTSDLMDDCEKILEACAGALGVWPLVRRGSASIDLTPPWRRLSVKEAFERFAGWSPGATPDPDRFDREMVEKVEPALPAEEPVFLHGYPASMASLARISPDDPTVADRVELYAGGLELANGFAELTDPAQQRERFVEEESARRSLGRTPYPMDHKFLASLEMGMKPCAGMALGLDRLVMLLTGAGTIDEVVAFPEGTA